MRRLFITISFVLAALCTLQAQELRCQVSVNSDKIQGTNKSVYNSLKQSLEEFINNTRFTNHTYAENERIECSMLIVVNSVEDNVYHCDMTLQSRRPVFGSSYMTPVLNYMDKNFTFTYNEYDRIDYTPNQFTTNLAALAAYYCYLIIGEDMDTFSRLGGTPYFTICEDIVTSCQSASLADGEGTGWKTFGSNRSRYQLINNLRDEAFRPYREYVYTYHRLGLDRMADNVTNGRAIIAKDIDVLRSCYNARPATYVINTFLDAKADELVQIFTKGTNEEKQKVYTVLMAIDATRNNTYEPLDSK